MLWEKNNGKAIGGIPSESVSSRMDSIDLLRGLAILFMILDHVRMYFHGDSMRFNPLDLSQTNILLYLTRWITHFCAPVFCFLAGTGAYLYGRNVTKKKLFGYLLSRGIWLVFLDLTVIRMVMGSGDSNTIALNVLWVLGCSMICLSGLIFLPSYAIVIIGAILIAGHNILDGITGSPIKLLDIIFNFLHVQSKYEIVPGFFVRIGYPLLPWIGIIALGFVFGNVVSYEPKRRTKLILSCGIVMAALFALLRFLNVYGDPHPWSIQKDPLFTFLSFMNLEKYPPSLLFFFFSLGLSLILLSLLEQGFPSFLRPFLFFGRAPMFAYIMHFVLIRIFEIVLKGRLFQESFRDFFLTALAQKGVVQFIGERVGYSLIAVFVFWVIISFLMIPICSRFARLKKEHKKVWLLRYF